MSTIPKAVLYYNPNSCWSSVALLALAEKGYAEDEVEKRIVDLNKGENFAPTFLRLNPGATVPTLIVPLQKTLSEDVESRYKAITETKAIVEFLDKSRSPLSHTHTTSNAPAPSLAPATIAFNDTSRVIVDLLHSTNADPNNLKYLNIVSPSSLVEVSKSLLPSLQGRSEALGQYITEAEKGTIQVTEKVKSFWRDKKTAKETLLDVLLNAEKEEISLDADSKLKRKEYLSTAQTAWQVNMKSVLETLNKEMSGPYLFGEQISIADLHLAGWLARIATLVGVSGTDDGKVLETKLGERIQSLVLPQDYTSTEGQISKIGAFWDAMRARESWKKVYSSGLH